MENNLHELTEHPAAAPVGQKKKSKAVRTALIAAFCLLGLVAVLIVGRTFGAPVIHYYDAMEKLERGEYADALKVFERLGDYKNAPQQAAEAKRELLYLDAKELLTRKSYSEAIAAFEELGDFRDAEDQLREARYLYAAQLLEQDDREAAKELLKQIAGYPDSCSALLRQIVFEAWYQNALQSMEKEEYSAAAEEFQALSGYKDAREKAGECRRLHTAKTAYSEGAAFYREGKWAEAYRTLSPIRDMNYKDTASILKKIEQRTEESLSLYAESGERGRILAFLRVMDEIDREESDRLRAELIPEETLEPDQSFYIYDTTHIMGFTANTTREEFASVVLYMLLHGKLHTAFMSNKPVDSDLLVDRAFQGCDLAQELLPGYGAIYNPKVAVGENYITFDLNFDEAYSEHQRSQHLKLFKKFCEESVIQLAEEGLLGSDMSRRQKAEVILNWVGFYLTYDTSMTTHDVGVAIEKKRGVCEAFAALYNRMCNLAGVPAFGQIGTAGGENGERHIWTFHVDEDGKIFYADATWADLYGLDFGVRGQEEPTIELFMEHYLDRCMESALAEQNGSDTYKDVYICSDKLWLTHQAERTPEDIMAYHAKVTGKAS